MAETKDKIVQKIQDSLENNATALGPALLAGYYMMEKSEVGSQIVLCTDGLANIGVGSLDGNKRMVEEAGLFYEDLAKMAQAKGI